MSGSVVLKVPTRVSAGSFSATLLFESATSVGASLTLVTLIVTGFSTNAPSWAVDRTRIV